MQIVSVLLFCPCFPSSPTNALTAQSYAGMNTGMSVPAAEHVSQCYKCHSDGAHCCALLGYHQRQWMALLGQQQPGEAPVSQYIGRVCSLGRGRAERRRSGGILEMEGMYHSASWCRSETHRQSQDLQKTKGKIFLISPKPPDLPPSRHSKQCHIQCKQCYIPAYNIAGMDGIGLLV